MRLAMGYLRLEEPARAIAAIEQLCKRKPHEARPQLWLGFICRAAGEPGRAESAYRHALEIDPASEPTYHELATVYLRQDREQDAVAILEVGIERVEEPADLLRLLGDIYIRKAAASSSAGSEQKNRKAAIRTFEQAVQAQPDDVSLLLQLGDLHVMEEEVDKAVQYFERIEEIQPDNLQVKKKLALSLAASGNEKRALETLEQLARKQPANPNVYYYLGELYEKMGDTEKAKLNFALATKADPQQASAFLRLALLQLEDEPEKAIAALEEGMKANPDDLRLSETMAYVFLNRKDYKSAQRYFQEAEQIIERNDIQAMTPAFYFNYAITAQYAGDLDRARELLGFAIDDNPSLLDAYVQYMFQEEDDEALQIALEMLEDVAGQSSNPVAIQTYIGLIHSFNKEYEEAVKAFERAEQSVMPDSNTNALNATFYFWYAAASERLGHLERSEELFRKSIAMEPEHAEAYNYLAYMWAERGTNLNEALTFIKKALEIEPESGAFIDTLGWIYFMQGRYEEARKQIERAASIIPADPTIAEHLGDIYMKLGQSAEAVNEWKRALQLDPENQDLREKLAGQGIDPEEVLQELPPDMPGTVPEPEPDPELLDEPEPSARHMPSMTVQ
jgi:tetratricopeptide (TPR) repeat protein